MWAQLPPPAPRVTRTAAWRAHPRNVAGLSVMRRRLRTALDDAALPAGADDGERLLLVVEELVSNALRHGRPPVAVTLTAPGPGWLVLVSDSAADRPPVPAPDRDPADGGMGLSLVARMCRAHGWAVEDDCKIVWARLPFLEPVPPDRARAVRSRALALVERLTDTAARTAGIMDVVAAREDAVGRSHVAHRFREAAERARRDVARARWVAVSASLPVARRPVD